MTDWERMVEEEEENKIVEDEDGEIFFEVHCRGPEKCGSFVTSEKRMQCPKCGSEKILLREVKKKVELPK
jgi:ABC-type ATPase with predicted acetyltransferase domain